MHSTFPRNLSTRAVDEEALAAALRLWNSGPRLEGEGDGGGDGGDGGEGDPAPDGGDGDGDGDGNDDPGRAGGPEALRRDLAAERERRKAEQQRVRQLEQTVAELQAEGESEVERARREAREEALSTARASARRSAVRVAATQAGFQDPEDAIALLDLDLIDVDDETLDADRELVETYVAELAETRPYLLDAERQGDEGGGGAPRGGADTQSGSGGEGGSSPDGSFMSLLRQRAGITPRGG